MPHYQGSATHIGPVGTNIYHARRKLKITQKQLATPEFSISYISAIERGRIRPSLKALEILAHRLEVTPAELLADLPNPLDIDDDTGYNEPESAPSLATLIAQRRSSHATPLALTWAQIALDQHHPQLAGELLEQLSPASLTAEQRLLRLALLGRVDLESTTSGGNHEAELERALHQQDPNGSDDLLERCRFILGCLYQRQDKLLPAADAFASCARAIEEGVAGDPLFAIDVYCAFAEYHQRIDRRDTAIDYYQRAIAQFDLLLKPTLLAETSAALSQEYLESAHSTLAEHYATRSQVLYELAGARQRLTQAISNLGLTLQEMGDTAGAQQQLQRAIDASEQLGGVRQGILARVALADLLLKREECQQAERLALEAKRLCQPGEDHQTKDAALYGRVLITLGCVYRALDRLDDAEHAFKQAISILEQEQVEDQLSLAYFHYSELLHQQGQFAESYEMVKQAYLLDKHQQG
jgi:tetratricopeptide (TPR) repeat protein/DNA-binding XRE family transcriptional regulator